MPQPDAALITAEAVTRLSYADLSPEVVALTKNSLLDTLGVTLAGAGLAEGSQLLANLVLEHGGKPEATILGLNKKVPAAQAALVNGAFAHALDYDDYLYGLAIHPSAVTVSAALAIAERLSSASSGSLPLSSVAPDSGFQTRSPISGSELITAIALGNEVAARIGLAMHRVPGSFAGLWHPTLLAGYFSATASAGKLLRLTAEQLNHAFGLALYRAGGTIPFSSGPRGLVGELYYGFPAELGVMCALMAQRGITGPTASFEGPGGLVPAFLNGKYDRPSLVDGWGKLYEQGAIMTYKPWPSVRSSHAHIQTALELVTKHDLKPADIREVVLHCNAGTRRAAEPLAVRRRPQTAIDAKFSIPFAVAVALAQRSVTVRDFHPTNLTNPLLLSLADRITVAPDNLKSGAKGLLEIHTTSGQTHRASVEHLQGDPDLPMSQAAIESKFRDCVASAPRPFGADKLIAAIMTLERAQDSPGAILAALSSAS